MLSVIAPFFANGEFVYATPKSRGARRRLLAYGSLIVVLLLTYIPLARFGWKGNTELHTVMEVLATIIAAISGVIALIRYYTWKCNRLLYIGTAFIGAALLDGYHSVVTSSYFHHLFPSPPPSLIPWSWNASRIFLSITMCLSWWAWRWDHKLGPRAQHKESHAYIAIGALTLFSFCFFAIVPLPRAYYPELIFGRPEEFIAAAFFAIALAGYLIKGAWRFDAFEHWCVLSLILGLFSQAMVMSHSHALFDAMFDYAHLLKLLSYTCVLVGLLVNMYHLLHRVESSTRELKQANICLMQSISERTEVKENLWEANEALESRASELENSRLAAINMMRDAENARQFAQQAEHELESALEVQQDAIQRQADSIRQLEFAHQELQQQKLRYQGILENVVDAVINISERGIIEDFNPAAEKMFGYTTEEVLGKNISLLMPSPHREDHDQHLDRYRSTGIKHIIGTRREAIGMRKNRETFPLQLSISEVIRTSRDNEQSRFFTGIIRDLTQQKEAETQLLRALKASEAATKSKSEFLANMSHEIRTPMTAILGFTEILLNDEGIDSAPPHRLEMFRTIQRNGDYLLELINDILDLSKIESAKIEVEEIEFSPRQILSEVASLMRVRAIAKGLPLETEFDGPIPEQIVSDPTRLRQILINLIGNAIKFSEVGKIRVLTRLLDADSETPRIQFNVIDSGIGMNKEQIDKLFHPFSQADTSTTRKFGGTGLGLTISKRLSEMLGGEINVQSTPGEGSIFSVTVSTGSLTGVKMIDRLIENKNSGERVKKPAARDVRLACRVLLAEDGPDNQRLIAFVLKKAGAEVEIAENGQIAFDLALAARDGENPFDVILMDMQMPVLDGYAATGRLRESGYTGPIIALTAHAMSSDREKCLDAGCDDYTTKPIDRKKLISLVGRFASQQTNPEIVKDEPLQQASPENAK